MPKKAPAKKNPVLEREFARIYPMYIAKAEKKNRTKEEVDKIIEWLFGYDAPRLEAALDAGTTLEAFVTTAAPKRNPDRRLITGTVCGVRVEDIKDATIQEMRYLDKLVDEMAKGRPLEEILRS